MSAPGDPNPLVFKMQQQLQSNWCWAATAASVSDYYYLRDTQANFQMGQEEIAKRCLSDKIVWPPDLPTFKTNWAGNQCWTLLEALQTVLHSAGPAQGPVLFEDVMGQIDQHCPVCCQIDVGNGHFVALIGYKKDTREVMVCDPLTPGNGWQLFDAFKQYGGGTWRETYFTH